MCFAALSRERFCAAGLRRQLGAQPTVITVLKRDIATVLARDRSGDA
jgi:hypothetical protein